MRWPLGAVDTTGDALGTGGTCCLGPECGVASWGSIPSGLSGKGWSWWTLNLGNLVQVGVIVKSEQVWRAAQSEGSPDQQQHLFLPRPQYEPVIWQIFFQL